MHCSVDRNTWCERRAIERNETKYTGGERRGANKIKLFWRRQYGPLMIHMPPSSPALCCCCMRLLSILKKAGMHMTCGTFPQNNPKSNSIVRIAPSLPFLSYPLSVTSHSHTVCFLEDICVCDVCIERFLCVVLEHREFQKSASTRFWNSINRMRRLK